MTQGDQPAWQPKPASVSFGSAVTSQRTVSPDADLRSAIQRANDAWVQADRTLDPSALSGAVGGKALQDDLAEIHDLSSEGHTRTNVNTQFSISDIEMNSPQEAVVTTHEVWYAEIFDRGGRLLQRTNAAEYDETYSVELQDGSWIVTANDIN